MARPRCRQEYVAIRIAGLFDDPVSRNVLWVETARGHRVRLPRSQVQFSPGQVFVPRWLYNKIEKGVRNGKVFIET